MTICNYTHDSMSDLITALERFAEAGIDQAFDGDMEELERHFAELRLTLDHN